MPIPSAATAPHAQSFAVDEPWGLRRLTVFEHRLHVHRAYLRTVEVQWTSRPGPHLQELMVSLKLSLVSAPRREKRPSPEGALMAEANPSARQIGPRYNGLDPVWGTSALEMPVLQKRLSHSGEGGSPLAGCVDPAGHSASKFPWSERSV